MKGAILEEGLEYYTYLDEVFPAFENEQLKYNWLISVFECNQYLDDILPYGVEYVWLSGKELTDMVCSKEIQFIWGVLSAFNKNIALEQVLKYDLPWADGYKGFWHNPISIQHPLADVEIVPWDSSLVLLIAKDNIWVDRFLKHFPLGEDLALHNSNFAHKNVL